MITVANLHTPVLLSEAIDLLGVRQGGLYVDGTAGLGGHAEMIAARLQKGRLILVDRDGEALAQARQRVKTFSGTVDAYQENFKNLPLVFANLGIDRIDGCLLDLGVSSYQLEDAGRGFSFQREGPLDMRMDRRQKLTASDLINQLTQEELTALFRRYGEEPSARRIAAAIAQRRRQKPITTTRELAELVVSIKGEHGAKTHPATRVFQALRIKVNQELEGLDQVLSHLIDLLGPAGRLVVISFHSLEDRIVKRTFRLAAGKCICFRPPQLCNCPRQQKVILLTRRPVKASSAELGKNPRARSARLRAVERKTGNKH